MAIAFEQLAIQEGLPAATWVATMVAAALWLDWRGLTSLKAIAAAAIGKISLSSAILVGKATKRSGAGFAAVARREPPAKRAIERLRFYR